MNKYLQGRVQFPIGGTAHEPQGMIRCNSEADSTVWMKEDDYAGAALLLMFHCSGIYCSGVFYILFYMSRQAFPDHAFISALDFLRSSGFFWR